MGRVTDISLHYRFALERENRPTLKSLHMLSQGKCLEQHSHIEFLISCKLQVEQKKPTHGQYEFSPNMGNASTSANNCLVLITENSFFVLKEGIYHFGFFL